MLFSEERLTANRVIRLRKAIDYIMDRLEPIDDTEESSRLRPEECLELWCQDQVRQPFEKPPDTVLTFSQRVNLSYTLAQLKTHVWKSGGDVTLRYKSTGRRKFHATRLRGLS